MWVDVTRTEEGKCGCVCLGPRLESVSGCD